MVYFTLDPHFPPLFLDSWTNNLKYAIPLPLQPLPLPSPPHGIVYDYSADENSTTAHIAELNFGYVSDYSSNPPCGRNPAFTMAPLDLSYNKFFNTGVPVVLAEMGGVLGIGLSGVGLVGNIPKSMGVFLGKLCYLGLDNNMLEGEVPMELGQLENVKELNLENNRLSGEIVFSANFTARKMKLGRNPGLCVISEKMEGYFGDLRTCRKAASPDAVA